MANAMYALCLFTSATCALLLFRLFWQHRRRVTRLALWSAVAFTWFAISAAAMSCVAVGTYFARFWRETGDRLFWCLAAAFGLFAINYAALGLLPLDDQRATYAFALRLVGFAAIVAGVLLKDRELADHLTHDLRDDVW